MASLHESVQVDQIIEIQYARSQRLRQIASRFRRTGQRIAKDICPTDGSVIGLAYFGPISTDKVQMRPVT